MFELKSILQMYTGLHTLAILHDDAVDAGDDADADPDHADDGATTESERTQVPWVS